jgi:hypothetical protein
MKRFLMNAGVVLGLGFAGLVPAPYSLGLHLPGGPAGFSTWHLHTGGGSRPGQGGTTLGHPKPGGQQHPGPSSKKPQLVKIEPVGVIHPGPGSKVPSLARKVPAWGPAAAKLGLGKSPKAWFVKKGNQCFLASNYPFFSRKCWSRTCGCNVFFDPCSRCWYCWSSGCGCYAPCPSGQAGPPVPAPDTPNPTDPPPAGGTGTPGTPDTPPPGGTDRPDTPLPPDAPLPGPDDTTPPPADVPPPPA